MSKYSDEGKSIHFDFICKISKNVHTGETFSVSPYAVFKIYLFLQVPQDKSDTQYVSEQLASGEQEGILSFLEAIKGPWALVYYHRPSMRLYFGRDVFGRHSLLWQLPSPQHPRLMVTSVWQQCDWLQEVPAYGLFFVDFSMMTLDKGFKVNLVPWSHRKEENLSSLPSSVEVVRDLRFGSHILQPLNMTLPSPAIIEQLKSLPPTLEQGNLETFGALLGNNKEKFLEALTQAVQRRVDKCPPCCQNCTATPSLCHHPRIAVLFSGGLDSAVLALLLDACLPKGESIDLLNVAFSQRVSAGVKGGSKHKAKKLTNSVAPPSVNFEVPDRVSGRECWQQLQQLRPHRTWNFVQVRILLHFTHLPTVYFFIQSVFVVLWLMGLSMNLQARLQSQSEQLACSPLSCSSFPLGWSGIGYLEKPRNCKYVCVTNVVLCVCNCSLSFNDYSSD